MSDNDLIARHIELDPLRPWPGEAILSNSGVPVWAIVGHFRATGLDLAAVAREYDVSEEEVAAALSYYRSHSSDIDARLAMNAPSSVA